MKKQYIIVLLISTAKNQPLHKIFHRIKIRIPSQKHFNLVRILTLILIKDNMQQVDMLDNNSSKSHYYKAIQLMI